MFKIALIQMLVEPGRKQENLARAEAGIRSASERGAELAVLPEALTLGWTDASAEREADEVPGGESCRRLREAAVARKIHVCAGIIERSGSRVFNSALLIGPGGEILLHHRKIYELGIAHDRYALGDRLGVTDTPLGRIGLMICADGFAPGQAISRTLALMGADLIISPAAWAVPADHDDSREPYGRIWLDHYGAVAREFKIWIAGVSNVGPIRSGPWSGRKCIGCSLLIGPDGLARRRGAYGEGAEEVLIEEIEIVPRPARGDGWERLLDEAGS